MATPTPAPQQPSSDELIAQAEDLFRRVQQLKEHL
jgi:hypothetical protein